MEVQIDYRNAKYQGQVEPQNSQRSGYGTLIDDDLSFYASDWKAGKLNNSSVIYISHGKYIYGQWQNNEPHGLNVFRIGDTVILSEFSNGKLVNKTLVIFQKVNFIAILQQNEDEQWNVVQSGTLFNYDELLKYIKEAEIPMKPQYFSLVKFLTYISNNRMKISPCRSSENCYFGFDEGLGIIFNPNNGVVSVGTHINKKLVQFGGRYELPNFVIEGNFQTNELVKYTKERPQSQIYAVFQKIHKKSLNFRNQYFDSKVKLLVHLEDLIRSKIDEIINNQKENTFTALDLNDSLDYHAENMEQINRIYKVREEVYQASIPIMKKTSSKYVQESPLLKKSTSTKIINSYTPTKDKQLITNAPASPIIMKKSPSRTPKKRSSIDHRKKTKNSEPVFQPIEPEFAHDIKSKRSDYEMSRLKKSSIKDRIQKMECKKEIKRYLPEETAEFALDNGRDMVSSKEYVHQKKSYNVPTFNYEDISQENKEAGIKKYLEYRQEKRKIKVAPGKTDFEIKPIQGPKYEDLSERRKRILKEFQQLNKQSRISVSPSPQGLTPKKEKKEFHYQYTKPQVFETPKNSETSDSRNRRTKVDQKSSIKLPYEQSAEMMPLSIKMTNRQIDHSPQESPAHILKTFNRDSSGYDKKILNKSSSPPEMISTNQAYKKQNYPSVQRFTVDDGPKGRVPDFGRKESYHEERDITPSRKRSYKYYFD